LADQREVLEEAGPAVALGKTLRAIAANRYDDVKDGYFRRRPRIPAPDQIEAEAAKSNLGGLSKNAQETLRLAAEAPFAPQPTPSPSGRKVVGLDRLAFGLLSMPPESRAWRTLHDMGIEPESLRSRFIERLTAEYPQQADVWHKALGQAEPTTRISVAEERTGQSSVYIATYTADNAFAGRVRDLIGVEDEARAFARIAASKNIRPPMAIGVFGEWGSGKTFFMERMSEHVTSLSQGAADAGPFYRDVVQIRFNAWHYMETNLWASLVEYIFHELDRWLRPQAPEQVDALFDQLGTSQQLKLEAIDELVFMRKQKDAAEQRLHEARQRYDQARLRPPAVTPHQFWEAVAETMRAEFLKVGKNEQFEAARKRLGLDELRASAQELNRILREANDQAGRGRVLIRAVIAKFGDVRWLVPAFSLVIVLAAGLVGLKEYLASATNAAWMNDISGSVLGVSGMLAAIAGIVSAGVRRVSSALATLESFKDNLDQAIVKQQQESQQKEQSTYAEAERQMADSKAALEQAERQLAEIAKRVDDAAREYASGTAQGRLNKFIREKVVNGDYAKHLGLIATIRKDFSQLAQLMSDDGAGSRESEEYQRAAKEHRQRLAAILRKSRRYLTKPECASLISGTRRNETLGKLFKRIILYIDDLDRCPPAKVVEVLQAIHLLLYFPLFIVVVAVDARWVSRSLKKQFPELLEENVTLATRDVSGHSMAGAPSTAADGTSALPSNGNGDGAARRNGTDARSGHAASSQDYLEKIFQIPYWVRRMDGDASKRYVDGLVAPDLQGPDTSKTSGERDPSPKRPEAEAASAPRPPEHAPRDVAPSRGANIRRPTTTEASPDDAAQPGGRPASDGTVSTNNEKAPAPVPVDFKSLLLTRPESEFKRELAP
ncbi:MAG: hypothetical protein L0210_04575, partial [Rhodospirillales bacterium]|nr:hypothetical protein [Rhodospirillales bacterium]